MKQMSGRDWKALTLLSIVVPVGLLVSFRLTGILPEPEGPITIAETTTLETLEWEFKRVSSPQVDVFEKVESLYDADVCVNQSVFIAQYHHSLIIPYGYTANVVLLAANITASLENGFIKSVYIIFRENHPLSWVDVWNPTEYEKHHLLNLTIQNWADKYDNYMALNNDTKAFIFLTSVSEPVKVHYWTWFSWVLESPLSEPDRLEISYEVTYFNGTVYKKVVQPFSLRMLPP